MPRLVKTIDTCNICNTERELMLPLPAPDDWIQLVIKGAGLRPRVEAMVCPECSARIAVAHSDQAVAKAKLSHL